MQQTVITGMGLVSSLGVGVSKLQSAMNTGETKFTRIDNPALTFPIICAPIIDFSLMDNLLKFERLDENHRSRLNKIMRQRSLGKQTSLIAMLEAWQQAQLDICPVDDTTHLGLVVGAQNSSSDYQYQQYKLFQQFPERLSPYYALHYMDTDYIGVLSDAFGIQGCGFTIGGATASGNMALIRAHQMIRSEEQVICAVVGPMAEFSPMELQAFHTMKAMGGRNCFNEPQKACRPFDQDHDGFIYGQASACIILESLDSALKRGVPILAYMLGGSILLSANHSANPHQYTELNVMRQAILNSKIDVNRIDYINAHGSSAPVGDIVELNAIDSFLGARASDVFVNSTKSITGHCFWSAGIVEAIATVIQMRDGFVHPTLNLEHPIDSACQLVKEKCHFAPIKTGLSNSFGFGGINTAIILSKNLVDE